MVDKKNKEDDIIQENQQEAKDIDLSSIDLSNFEEAKPENKVDDQLNKLQEENTKLKDQMLRAFAENDNLRKRYEKQIDDTAKYAVSSIAKDLIEVAENFFRATEAMPKEFVSEEAKALQNIAQGFEMTKNQFISILEKHGVKRINPAAGEDFDHNLHQAVMHAHHDEIPHGKITSSMQAGYLISDRLLRPAMVSVSKGKENNNVSE